MIKLKPGQMLITLSVILVAFMIVFSSWISDVFGKTVGYIASNLVYWFVFCIPVSVFLLRSSGAKITDMYVKKHRMQHNNLYNAFAFLPVIATGFIVFVPTVQKAPAMAILIAFIYAVINGAIEEIFWRGIYNVIFKHIATAYIVPTILFPLWHLALVLVKGMTYHGGALVLLSGSAFMGALWGAVTYKTKSIRYTTIAHVMTNFFAFSGLIYDNWFI